MNQNLKKDYTLEKNYRLLSQQFGKLISFGRRSSSAERKSIRVLKNSAHRKTTSNSKRILLSNNLRLFENNSAVNLTKNMSTNAITNYHNKHQEKINNIKIIKGNNITDITLIFKSKEKARTFNRQPSTNQIKETSGLNSINNINKIKSNQITYNNIMRIKNDKNKNNREIYKKKLVIENPSMSSNDMNNTNNKTTNIKNKIFIRNNSNFNMRSSHNSSTKRNTDISQGKLKKDEIVINTNMNKDIKNARKIKLKNKIKNKNKDPLMHNFNYNYNYNLNHTMNTKIKRINETNNNIHDLKQKIIVSNSFKGLDVNNENKNTNLDSILKKKKNIDINTEFQYDPIIHKYSMDNHNLYINNKITDSVNNYNNSNNVIFFNNTTTSKVKTKIFEINKDKENIRFTENSNTIFKTKAKTKVKNTEIIKKESSDIKSKLDKESNIKVKNTKNLCKNVKNDINRNSTYNNESSFFTINNGSNIDENYNNEHKNNIVNYYFVSSAHDKDKMNKFNIITQGNKTINNKNKNAKKINKINVFKANSNTNKNKILQNSVFDYVTDSHNFTTDNFIKNKNETTLNNNLITNTKSEENPKMTNEVKSIKIQSSMSNKDNNGEATENLNLNFLNNIEEIKEKDTFLDKSTSRVIQMHQEDFIEKDDEVINLFKNEQNKENNNIINNNINNKNEEESEVIRQNSELSIVNNNYILNNQNIYQNININIFQNGSNNTNNNKIQNENNNNNNLIKTNLNINQNNNNNNQNGNINIDNTTMRDISISSNCGIRASKSLTQAGKERTGHRKKNQDNYIIEKNINNILEFNIFAVLDGHGDNGHIVSQLASKYLIKKFTNLTKDFGDTESIYNFLKKSDYQKIINIFLETDTEIITKTKFDISLSGSTCVFVIQLGEHIICANIGDSRAILVYDKNGQNNIFELSHDSKPDVPEEKKRIELLGGTVRQVEDENGEKTGPYRVYMKNSEQPGLAMSRSFGDKKAKFCGVIPIPDIVEYNLKWNYKYMVICSDGVWEFLSNEEVMEIGNKYFYQNDINEFCKQLLKRSTEIWENEENYMDDITIVVVFF